MAFEADAPKLLDKSVFIKEPPALVAPLPDNSIYNQPRLLNRSFDVRILQSDRNSVFHVSKFKLKNHANEPKAMYIPTLKPERTTSPIMLAGLGLWTADMVIGAGLAAFGKGRYKNVGFGMLGAGSGAACVLNTPTPSMEQAPVATVVPTQTTELLQPTPTAEIQRFPTAIPPTPELKSYPVDGSNIGYMKYEVFTDLDSITNKWGIQFRRMIDYYIPALQLQFPNEVKKGGTIDESIANFFKVFEVRGYANAELGCAAMVPYHREKGQFFAPIVEGVRSLDLMVHQDFMDSHEVDGSGITFSQIKGTDIACSNQWPIVVERFPNEVGNTMYLVTDLTRLPIDSAELTAPLELHVVATQELKSEVLGKYPVTIDVLTDKSVVDAFPVGNNMHVDSVGSNPYFISKESKQVIQDGLPDATMYAMYLAWQNNFADPAINLAHANESYATYVDYAAKNDQQAITPILARDWENPSEPAKLIEIFPGDTTILFVDASQSQFRPFMDRIQNIRGEDIATIATFVKDKKLTILVGLPSLSKYASTGMAAATYDSVLAISRLSDLEHQTTMLPKTERYPLGAPVVVDYIAKRLLNYRPDGSLEQTSLMVYPQH